MPEKMTKLNQIQKGAYSTIIENTIIYEYITEEVT